MKYEDRSVAVTRRDFLKLGGVLAAGLLIDGYVMGSDIQPASADKTKEIRFEANPSWEQDLSKMPDGKLNPRYWNIDTGNLIPSYTGEVETLTNRPENVRIQGGALILEARKEKLNGREYTSGRVNTQGKFSFQYGKLEVVLKAPKGIGTWPAAWLLPNNPKATWPLDGEPDFFEGIGSLPNQVYPALHTYDSEHSKNQSQDNIYINVPDEAEEYHTFGIEMTLGNVGFTYEENVYYNVKKPANNMRAWPFDQPYYLIFDLAMGGPWAGADKKKYPPDGIEGNGPWQMTIQSARYYDLVT